MNELAKQRVCVLIRGGVELWIDAGRREELKKALADKDKRFLEINGQLVNTYEIIGVYTAETVEESTRRKNGQWKCDKGKWHEKGDKCFCPTYTETVTGYVEGIGKVTFKR